MGQQKKTIDSTYRKSFPEQITFRANMDTYQDSYILQNEEDNSQFSLLTNNTFKLYLSFNYKFIGGSIGFSPDIFSNSTDEYLRGKSSFTNYKFNFFLGKWVQGFEYNKTRGFYVENTKDYIQNWIENKDPYIQFPNLKSVTWGMSTSYVFNSNFSYRNMVYQSEWQKRSAGSFVPTLFYNYNRTSFSSNDISSTDDSYNIRLATAYYYTLVLHENWFISPFLSPSLGVRFTKSTTNSSDLEPITHQTYLTKVLEGGLQLGYSSTNLFFGTNFNFISNSYNESDSEIIYENKVYALLYLGYRFNPPKMVSKTMGKIKNIITN